MRTAVSLFAGCGGDTLGLELAGLEVVGFVEFWKPAIASHLANFPKSEFIGEQVGGDITKIPDAEFLRFRGKIDVLFAGFPCQGFSHAGKKDPNDPRNKLFWEFVRAAKLIQPRWVIGENVSGLLHRRTDDGLTPVSQVIVDAFEEIGYTMAKPTVLNAADYGVPQKRKRVFFVGSREGQAFEFPSPTHGKKPSQERPVGSGTATRFSLVDAIPFDPDAVSGTIARFVEENARGEPSGKPHPYLLSKWEDKLMSANRRISPYHVEVVDLDHPAKTIHSGYSFQPRLFVPLKNRSGTFLRPFTVPELGVLQGFPWEFEFCGSQNDAIVQIGNAVPPPLAAAVARQVLACDAGLVELSARRKLVLA